MTVRLTRRSLLKSGVMVGGAMLGGCCWLQPRDPGIFCPGGNGLNAHGGRLTIDAHTHVFNGTDLPIEPFFRLVLARKTDLPGGVARVIGQLLQAVAWEVAPDAQEEMAAIKSMMPDIERCEDRPPAVLETRLNGLADAAHKQGVNQLQQALASPMASLVREKAAGVGSASAIDMLAASAVMEEIGRLKPDEKYRDYRRRLWEDDQPLAPMAEARRTARGMVAFILQNFQYRYVSIHDYLRLYNQPGKRVIDLMMPMMVDYDWWLDKGNGTLSSLEDQVSVMEKLAIATGGRVHAFVPFDPLREVMHGISPSNPSSLDLVKRALGRGCIGVKLYPPMGFAPLGNARIHRKNPDFWHRDWLPDSIKVANLGQRLDDALHELYRYCIAHDIPIMAHTGLSNGAADDFEALAGAPHWRCALEEYCNLRINFGHFGDTEPVAHEEEGYKRALGFADLMHATGSGRRAYADSGFFTEAMHDGEKMRALLQRLYTETQGKGNGALANRFLYGTDWEMTITHGRIDSYLSEFEEMFSQLVGGAAFAGERAETLARKFFGVNAVAYAGLRAGDETRKRLQKFYDLNRIPTPEWMKKADTLTA